VSTATAVWYLFCFVALLALAVLDLQMWATVIVVAGPALACVPALRPHASSQVDLVDLAAVVGANFGVMLLFPTGPHDVDRRRDARRSAVVSGSRAAGARSVAPRGWRS
jgi:hypothetical protein